MLILFLVSAISDPTQRAIDKTYSIHSNTAFLLDPTDKLTTQELLLKPITQGHLVSIRMIKNSS